MYIQSNVSAGLLFVQTDAPLKDYCIKDANGEAVDCPLMGVRQKNGAWVATLDASNLKPWAVYDPVLYTIEAEGETVRFGHTSISTFQNKMVLHNDKPIYLRGYIRGIVAHEHPNMTGLSDYEAAVKNIKQAKKYGFNIVRFHSTIPSEDFVRAADELGMLVHIELSFTFERYTEGDKINLKKNVQADRGLWERMILKYRNNPSVAIFCIGNELHNASRFPIVKEMCDRARQLAPGKLAMDTCGWGEFDREGSDIFCQHIAYFLPYAHHAEMFSTDFCWREDGSAYNVPMKLETKAEIADTQIYRNATPLRPTLSHEAMHYVDIPDYAALEKKFDDFCAKVGPAYLEKHGIKKPKYFAGLKKLIADKGLADVMPDYIAASRQWKLMATKIFMEKLRLSNLCGFEMLQFSDCLKYENKNGIVDFFDDDKGIDPKWLLQLNDDLVLVADIPTERLYEDETIRADIYASDFLPQPYINGTLEVTLDGEQIYLGEHFALAGGLQRLAELKINPKATGKAHCSTLAARFVSDEGLEITNSWKLWLYPRVRPVKLPELAVANEKLAVYLSKGTEKVDTYVTDTFDQTVFDKLQSGKTVVLLYTYGAERNTWQMPGAMERFKPCIWDRGSNLGGIFANKAVAAAVAADKYFDLNMQPLLEAGHKVNLDDFPCKVEELVQGIDKPIRDRYKGLEQGIKDFLPTDTLRRFSHLFSLKIGAGTLVVCTFNLSDPENPVASNFLELLIDRTGELLTEKSISDEEFKSWLIATNEAGFREEDTMNRVWTRDSAPVEKTLFWEDLNLDLTTLKN